MNDISTIVAASRGVDIKHPATGEAIGLQIMLRPASSPEVQAARRKMINDRLRHDLKPSAELIEANRFALIAAAVEGWNWQGDLTFEGSKPEFNAANLEKVLKKLPWLRDQIDTECGNDAAFFENSANA